MEHELQLIGKGVMLPHLRWACRCEWGQMGGHEVLGSAAGHGTVDRSTCLGGDVHQRERHKLRVKADRC
ncbi:hypothetical protein HaLaN_21927 [Haematococcus lacustris]|uniref:Uncharacterized protein n=1 Tax=Haematococcus lacustris TaxID=44745 RepID=A0A699ZNC9_HAELA|nr:hypothetical protein HaLaN_21927 [Haematococcus lacustris]